MPVQNLIAIPDAIGFVEAAAFPLAFLTAWHMLITRAKLRAGEDVLVLGAGQRRRAGRDPDRVAARRARVCDRRHRREAGQGAPARRLRGDQPHHRRICRAKVREFTNGRGVDVVVEHVGTATWDRSLKSLARGGRLVTCGATTGHDAQIDLRVLFTRQISLLGSYMGRKAELLRAAQFFFAGELRPVVDRTFPLAEAAEAHRRLESREQFGKLVLVV